MTEAEFIAKESRNVWEGLERSVAEVTERDANHWPGGSAWSIGACYTHVLLNTDVEVNRLMYGREPIVEAEWAGDVGQGYPYDAERFDHWERGRGATVDWDRLREYGRSVHRAFVADLDALTEADLDRPVDMSRAGLGVWEGRNMLRLHGFTLTSSVAGEIRCLKLLQREPGSRRWG